jgi:hypothetical protein
MEEGRGLRAARVGGGDGGTAIAAAESSPELPNRVLQGLVFKLKSIGMMRGQRRTRRSALRGRGIFRTALAMDGSEKGLAGVGG